MLEDLKIQNMVRKPKARQVNGKWVKNGARAKAGLNRSILSSCWGRIDTYLTYKAARLHQLVLKVPAAYSSQECSECEHTHAGNRSDPATFVCQGCGYQAHADFNASRVIKKRGLKLLEAGISDKPKKQASIRRKTEYKTECGTRGGTPLCGATK